jgi:6-phosphogluconolactonase
MKNIVLYAGICMLCLAAAAACSSNEKQYKFLIGTYTQNTESRGIYACSFNMNTGKMNINCIAEDAVNPSYLAIDQIGGRVYAVNEAGESSAITAFVLNANNDSLLFLMDRQSPDIDPCHLAVSRRHIITAGYTDGCIAVYERDSAGNIGDVQQTIYYTGRGADKERQRSPHLHQVVFASEQKFLLACDFGTDKIMVYRYDEQNDDVLTAIDSIKLPAGSGIRHIAINKAANMVYGLGELDGSITAMRFDAKGHLSVWQRVFAGEDSVGQCAAAVKISTDGKFLYATNRCSANQIACFAIGNDGALSFVERQSTAGTAPRDFAITDDGKYIFIANQNSSNITAFERDMLTGKLKATGNEWQIPAPVCVVEY